MLMGKGVQLVGYSERRLVSHDICCFTCFFFSSSFRLGTIVQSLPKIVKTFNCVKNRSHLYADDRYGECDVGTVIKITKQPNVICYYFVMRVSLQNLFFFWYFFLFTFFYAMILYSILIRMETFDFTWRPFWNSHCIHLSYKNAGNATV